MKIAKWILQNYFETLPANLDFALFNLHFEFCN